MGAVVGVMAGSWVVQLWPICHCVHPPRLIQSCSVCVCVCVCVCVYSGPV